MGLALVEKDEDIVTQDVLMQLVGHDAAQAIKRFSHIDARLAQEVPRIGIKG